MLVAGIAGSFIVGQHTLSANAQTSPAGAEVSVTIKMPEDAIIAGTVIIVLEDITFQDVPSVELARLEVPATSLLDNQAEVVIPIDLQAVNSEAIINVAVLIDADNSGAASNGDWISDSLVPVITNSKMKVSVNVARINAQ